MDGILEKYCCRSCDFTFLVDQSKVISNNHLLELNCPRCEGTAERIASSDPDGDIADQLGGCLWPK